MVQGTLDRADLDNLARRERQLWILATVIVLILAGGVAALMYPLVFLRAGEGNKWTLRFAFLGFCVLSVLFVAYLLDSQRTVRRLKEHLVAELKRNLELRNQANVDLLHTIPDLTHFQDRLAMEYRRAATTQRSLSLLVLKTKPSRSLPGLDDLTAAWGDAAKALSSKLRPTDSIYRLGPGLFGIVLPETDTANASRIALRLEETLRSVEARNGLSFEIMVHNYPQHVGSAHEFEEIVTSLLSEKQPWQEPSVTRAT